MGRDSIRNKVNEIKTIIFGGLKISLFSIYSLENYFKYVIDNNLKAVIHGYSLTSFYYYKSNKLIFPNQQKSDIFLSDGRGFYFLLKFLGINDIEYFSIPDCVYFLLNLANKNKYSVLLLGSKDETNKKATNKIKKNYLNAIIYNGIDGYFTENDELKIVNKINECKPNIIFIGISSPKKELFVNKWKNQLKTNLIINCGGMIDVLAGETRLPPKIIQKAGLSWLYRVIQEPKRLYKVTLKNGILALFILIPKIIFEYKIKKNSNFSIPQICKFAYKND